MNEGWGHSKRFVVGWLLAAVLLSLGLATDLGGWYLLGLLVFAVTTAAFATARLESGRSRMIVRGAALVVLVGGVVVPWVIPARRIT